MRDFNYNEINGMNINKSTNNFEGFTASGLTFERRDKIITIITRYEEVNKLLIHELFHNFNLDNSSLITKEFDILNEEYKNIKNSKINNGIINYDYQHSIFESYTELSSSYFNIIFKILSKYHKIKKDKILNVIIKNIVKELIYSYNTVYNLAKLNGYKDYDDFINKQVFYGDICFYEYYYLKALMYNNYEYVINVDGIRMYKNIFKICNNKDLLLKEIFNNGIKQYNYKYCYL